MLCVGAAELPEFHRQQAEFAAVVRADEGDPREFVAEGADHFTVLDHLSHPGAPLHHAVTEQILR